MADGLECLGLPYKEVEVQQVIITRLRKRGTGERDDPVREIIEIWDMEGNKITEIDPCQCQVCVHGVKEA